MLIARTASVFPICHACQIAFRGVRQYQDPGVPENDA
jgi:hypothetical protein